MAKEIKADQEAEKIKAQSKLDAEYKEKYKYVLKAENINEAGKAVVCYFREPSRIAFGVALAKIDTNVVEACEIIFNDSVIQEISDWQDFASENKLFYSLIGALQGLAKQKKSVFTS